MIIVIMGVAGSGKTTVGVSLADELGWEFIDGDRLHTPDNIENMRAGQPLTDADRELWLDHIETVVKEKSARVESAVLAASALRRSHRDRIRSSGIDVTFVYLWGDFDLIQARLKHRRDHFFGPDMLASQFAALEPPEFALEFDISQKPAEIVRGIREALAL